MTMADDSDREWTYGIDDVGEDEAERGGEGTDGSDGPETADRRIEPESPSLENALFVALGALLALAVIARSLGLL